MSAKKATQESAKSKTAIGKTSKGFTDEERVAMKERAQELKVAAQGDKSDGESALLARSLVAEEVVWGAKPGLPPEGGWFEAQIRYRAAPALAWARPLEEGRAEIEFQHPQRAIAPGQAVVCYQGDGVAFGGRIGATRMTKEEEKWRLSLLSRS